MANCMDVAGLEREWDRGREEEGELVCVKFVCVCVWIGVGWGGVGVVITSSL